MKLRRALLVPLFLSACGQDVRSLRLDQVDLADMAQVQRLGQALDPAERPAFTTFVAIHGRTAGNCGITLGGGESRTPETIGEAIDAMQLRLAQVQASSAAPGGAPEPPIAPSGAYTGPSLAEVNRQMEILER